MYQINKILFKIIIEQKNLSKTASIILVSNIQKKVKKNRLKFTLKFSKILKNKI